MRSSPPAALLVAMLLAASGGDAHAAGGAESAAAADSADAGREALRTGDYERAAAELGAAVAGNPGRLDLRRDHGLALLFLRRFDEACRELRRVAQEAPEDATTVRAHALCERLRRRPARIHAVAEVGLQYDSNVVLDPTAPAPGGGAARTVARLGLSARLLARDPFWLDTEGGYYQSVHFNQRDELGLFDVSAPEARLTTGVAGRRVAASIEGRWRETWTDMYRVHYGREAEAAGRLGARLRGEVVASLCYRLRVLRFFDVNLPGRDDRDALQQEIGLEGGRAFGRRLPLVSGYAAYLRHEADGDNFDFHGARVAGLVRVMLLNRVTVEALGAYTYRDFVNASLAREDHEVDGVVAASLTVRSGVSVILGYQHTVNLSSVAADRYQRAIVSLAVRGEL